MSELLQPSLNQTRDSQLNWFYLNLWNWGSLSCWKGDICLRPSSLEASEQLHSPDRLQQKKQIPHMKLPPPCFTDGMVLSTWWFGIKFCSFSSEGITSLHLHMHTNSLVSWSTAPCSLQWLYGQSLPHLPGSIEVMVALLDLPLINVLLTSSEFKRSCEIWLFLESTLICASPRRRPLLCVKGWSWELIYNIFAHSTFQVHFFNYLFLSCVKSLIWNILCSLLIIKIKKRINFQIVKQQNRNIPKVVNTLSTYWSDV